MDNNVEVDAKLEHVAVKSWRMVEEKDGRTETWWCATAGEPLKPPDEPVRSRHSRSRAIAYALTEYSLKLERDGS